eukprot:NODE_671_length_2196_cov_74.073806_g641_i0.p1 GENE.NODE_671_length_2196_cov_74.073806_g641_i0~~NODE_671_length_2196_cov_74.073806_g641_i0.p1  ORF type:complete len:370 (+),score=45.05 NODE_671_length_2196_cov_74.073806_g641_i0:100-1209(+)
MATESMGPLPSKQPVVVDDTRSFFSGPTPGYWAESVDMWKENWSAALGDSLNWYEWSVYSYLEPQMAANFFGGSQLVSWLAFGSSFLSRPAGGFVLGVLSDTMGRKPAVIMCYSGMLVATVGQGFMPVFHGSLHPLSAIGLVSLRILQGVATGGEVAAQNVYMIEKSPLHMKGMAASFMSLGSSIGFTASSLVAALLTTTLTPAQLLAWGWRIPYIIVVIPGFASIYFFSKLEETKEFADREATTSDAADTDTSAAGDIMRKLCNEHSHQLSLSLISLAGPAAIAYVGPVYAVSYMQLYLHIPAAHTLWMSVGCQLFSGLLFPLWGLAMDTYGVGKMFQAAGILCFLVGAPSYMLLQKFHSLEPGFFRP